MDGESFPIIPEAGGAATEEILPPLETD
ncbi:MAG: hypothetical protein JWQ49_4315, partial [Edaphobacter sp.]|nr:hypothetical protein [Edaphobacter sp.]